MTYIGNDGLVIALYRGIDDSDGSVAGIIDVDSIEYVSPACRSVDNGQQRTSCRHIGIIKCIEVASQHDRRRRIRRRYCVDTGLDVVEQRRGLVLRLRRVVQRADKRNVRHSLDTQAKKFKLGRVDRVGLDFLLFTYTATPPPRRPARSRRWRNGGRRVSFSDAFL